MIRFRRWTPPNPGLALLLASLAVGVGAIGLTSSDRPASAQPPAPSQNPAQALRYVPADAAFFVHVNAAKLWDGVLGKAVRTADPKTFTELTAKAKALFGITPDGLESVTLFWPQIKGDGPPERLAVVGTFHTAPDNAKLSDGFSKLFAKGTQYTLHTPSERVVILLIGLDSEYAKPRPADATGPLTAAIREAATGQHFLVAGSTLANLPDEIRGDDLPPDIQPFKPLFHADSVVGIVDLGKELSAEVRVKASTPAKAAEAEKGMGLLAKLLQQGLAHAPKELGQDAEKNPALKDLFTLLNAVQAGVKGAKFTADGTEARVRVAIPADLPFAGALASYMGVARESAVRAQSLNNLRQIAIAMHAHHDTYGTLPPAAVVNKTGKPLLSWRVLVLPFVAEQVLYQQFRLDEAWDSEHNKKLIAKMPRVYTIPGDTIAKPGETRYRVFVGNGAGFDYIRGAKFAEFTDGLSNTLMVVTAAEAVTWTKPDELAFDPEKDMSKLLGPVPDKRFLAAFFDGSVRTFSKPPATKTLNAMITRAGGEIIDPDAP